LVTLALTLALTLTLTLALTLTLTLALALTLQRGKVGRYYFSNRGIRDQRLSQWVRDRTQTR